MILIFTGNGKGKTTAALGQMVRVAGRGKSALMVQFIKGPWRSGEDDFGKMNGLPPELFDVKKMGLGFVGILGDPLPLEDHKQAARKALEYFVEQKITKKWHLIVLDEVNNAIALGLIGAGDVLAAIADYPKDRLLVLTGRDAPQELVAAADLVTEMREMKHPFADGVDAQPTVEF